MARNSPRCNGWAGLNVLDAYRKIWPPIGRYSGGSINDQNQKRINCLVWRGCRCCCRSVSRCDVGGDEICCNVCGAARSRMRWCTPYATAPGREVRISLLDREPGASSARHRHPGHHTFGYVIEGTYEFGINGQPSRTLNAGETFYEPPTAIHSTSRNPSTDKRTKILVFMVADQKNPSTVAE